ncbi:MAG: hypothetical protein ABIQ40_01995 [Bacteroidia bacterium]
MIEPREKIKHQANNDEALICICKNTTSESGFYPCNEEGNEIEPTKASGWNGLYVCADCGRIIDSETLEVVGENPDFKMLP